jgi:hypothetical protein
MSILRDKYKHFWFAEKILQKATGYQASIVKQMLKQPVKYTVTVTLTIENERIIELDSKLISII